MMRISRFSFWMGTHWVKFQIIEKPNDYLSTKQNLPLKMMVTSYHKSFFQDHFQIRMNLEILAVETASTSCQILEMKIQWWVFNFFIWFPHIAGWHSLELIWNLKKCVMKISCIFLLLQLFTHMCKTIIM